MTSQAAYLSNLTSRDYVIKAIEEYVQIGPDDFFLKYRYRDDTGKLRTFASSNSWPVFYRHGDDPSRPYPSKAIAAVAHDMQNPNGPRLWAFSGGLDTVVRRLESLDPEGEYFRFRQPYLLSEISKSPRVPRRSYEEWLVAFFLSKFGQPRKNEPSGPPLCFGTRNLKETIELFYGTLGRGRTPRSFYLSMKNARDVFDGHTQTSGRVGWKSGNAPQNLPNLAQEVWNDLSPLTELEMTDRVYSLLQSGRAVIAKHQGEIPSVTIGLTSKSGIGNPGQRRSENATLIGRLAEDWVREHLENKEGVTDVRHHSVVGETPGYDLSYQNDLGEIVRIEVKGTKNPTMTTFDLTRNEWNAAKKFRSSYKVWIVTDVMANPKIHELEDPYGEWEHGGIGIEPMVYQVSKIRAK